MELTSFALFRSCLLPLISEILKSIRPAIHLIGKEVFWEASPCGAEKRSPETGQKLLGHPNHFLSIHLGVVHQNGLSDQQAKPAAGFDGLVHLLSDRSQWLAPTQLAVVNPSESDDWLTDWYCHPVCFQSTYYEILLWKLCDSLSCAHGSSGPFR